MIQLVYEAAKKCPSLNDVVVATDDERIQQAVELFGGKVMMTKSSHESGTDRCAEVIEKLQSQSNEHFDIAVNIQGDEPFIKTAQIEAVIAGFKDENTAICTLAKKLVQEQEIQDPNVVKVVKSNSGKALYFSRSPIPFVRNQDQENATVFFKHIGIYAYKTSSLTAISQLQQSVLEKAESLEQLRWLENGFTIQVQETNLESIGIDTPSDLNKINTSK